PSPTSINPDLPFEVGEVILQCLSKDPYDRFATAGDLASTLEMSWSNTPTVRRPRKKSAPMLPAGVPPAAAVPSITLPIAAAIAPITARADVSPPELLSISKRKAPLLPGWWPVAVA